MVGVQGTILWRGAMHHSSHSQSQSQSQSQWWVCFLQSKLVVLFETREHLQHLPGSVLCPLQSVRRSRDVIYIYLNAVTNSFKTSFSKVYSSCASFKLYPRTTNMNVERAMYWEKHSWWIYVSSRTLQEILFKSDFAMISLWHARRSREDVLLSSKFFEEWKRFESQPKLE